jgi:isoleucyl-tRNA synthetase
MSILAVPSNVDFPAVEREVLEFWQRSGAFEALRAQNAGKPRWSFLDGPITANNPMGVHHAWGRTYKDVFQRYHAGLGQELRYQNGFDCQGLWVEVEVEKANGFKSKRDIEQYGIDRFVQDCKERVLKYSGIQAKQSQRLGYWMDWDNSYYTMSEENNYAIWSFLRKCHEQGQVYKSTDLMPWCGRCGTGLSHMELSEGYKAVLHTSVFVAFPLREREGEALLVWTTTPWTLTSNVAAAVSSKMTYLRVRAGTRIYYVAKANFTAARAQPATPAHGQAAPPNLMPLRSILKNAGGGEPEILGELSGAELVGLTYDGPFDDIEGAAGAREAHRVVDWDHVTEGEGSGIVHIAPGCGGDDYRLGQAQGLPKIAPLDESGNFKPGFGPYSGRAFAEVGEDIVTELKSRGVLVAKERYFHRYPHCWRCSSELAYRLVDEWFISMAWRQEIMESAKQAQWLPEWGLDRELDWLKNMGDWMISKKRYWGLALPIWECGTCKHFDVVANREDLKARASAGWDEFEGHTPHRPWVDKVKIRCEKCGDGEMSRVRDVGNPWLDASIVPFSTLHYFTDRAYWDKWFPADFVVESLPGQFRNWFYALLAVSTKLSAKSPFKTLLGHGLVLDEHHEEMHKSKGNAIWFDDAVETMGADVMRWLYCGSSPEQNVAFGTGPADEVRRQIVLPLWNVYRFFANLAAVDDFKPSEGAPPVAERSVLDRWILSELQSFVDVANRGYAGFDTQSVVRGAERFIERLSNWYLRSSRRRFYGQGWPQDKRAAYHTLYEVLDCFVQCVSPIMPFLTEHLYQNLVRAAHGEVRLADATPGGSVPASVHHRPFPSARDELRAPDLDAKMNALLEVVNVGRSVRNANRLKTRQPLAAMILKPRDAQQAEAIRLFEQDLLAELNVKRLEIKDSVDDMRQFSVKLDFSKAGPLFGKQVKQVAAALERIPAAEIQSAVSGGRDLSVEIDGAALAVPLSALKTDSRLAEGWVGIEERETVVLLDSRITPEVAREGVAREVTRNIQILRKEADLQIEERIVVGVVAKGELVLAAISEWQKEIAEDVLAVAWHGSALDAALASSSVQLGDGEVQLTLTRAAS